MFERTDNAVRRDEQANLRDLQAAARDRAAQLRDRAADEHEKALGRTGAATSLARATAAADRARAADDRARAADDRTQAAADREQAAAEIASAHLDDLTGFYRLGLGQVVLQREIDRARRGIGSLILAYCDVDGLKKVNDGEGHAAGDALLKVIADAIRSRLRSYDTVVRVGGDEFVCALTEIDLEQAAGIFDEIQTALGEMRDPASISYGLARLRDGDSLAELMDRSDGALRKSRVSRR
jgi:diguanylate cyclase